ncbi:hypothetical protein ADL04_17445 [Streptomyces sp. NRRL B-3648]|nr:hypothetical protein ADL04_17445 [Streptomyces sp. NRRL B-3648]
MVLDTPGSTGTTLLGKALGTIASNAGARDGPATRAVFCDAAPHDAGDLPVTGIDGRAAGTQGTRLPDPAGKSPAVHAAWAGPESAMSPDVIG